MAPEHLKLGAIAFAVVSVICLGWAANEWAMSPAASPAERGL